MKHPVNTPAINTRYAPAAEYCRLTQKEEHYLDDHSPSCLHFKRGARPRCVNVVNVGLFFDGTNNNMKRDYDDKPPATRCHSNVVRLYLAYPDKRSLGSANQYFPYYMPGVGTPFPEIGETTETQAGKAFAKGGQARILWAVLQVYNAVHRAVYDNEPLFSNDEMASLIKDYEHKVDDQRRPDPEAPPILRRDWFRPLTERLSQKLRERLARRLPEIPLVSLSVFGFSRGAVEARAFCYWYQDALQDGLFAGSETEIKFLGVFDSVASVGTSASMHEQFGLWILSGHSSWAAEILKPLPAIVKKTVHLMAAHEVRMNFPLTRVVGGNVEEWLFPGAHSDVGGGYPPGDQGRARWGQASLLSQIPLLHMYRAALVAGVPLTRFDRLVERVRRDFEVSVRCRRTSTSTSRDWARTRKRISGGSTASICGSTTSGVRACCMQARGLSPDSPLPVRTDKTFRSRTKTCNGICACCGRARIRMPSSMTARWHCPRRSALAPARCRSSTRMPAIRSRLGSTGHWASSMPPWRSGERRT